MPPKAWASLNERIVACERCSRLRQHCLSIAEKKRKAYEDWRYWGRAVPNFGDPAARLLIVGLAPGAHGANRTGRMFTGDRSGDWLYRSMHRAGFASQPTAENVDDGLELVDCAITAVCHCAPPDNRPTTDEVAACREYLETTWDLLPVRVVLTLGGLAWTAACRELSRRGWLNQRPRPKFSHQQLVPLSDRRWLLGSYHPSQQNTFTGRLTEQMLDDVFYQARELLSDSSKTPPNNPAARRHK